MQPIYISAATCTCAQPTFGASQMPDEPTTYQQNLLRCIEHDCTAYINPVQIRRMSRMLKLGFSTATLCMQQAENKPDAIIIGTGKGSMHDTEQFLHAMHTYQETALNATHFIHSTYNQLNGMIALQHKINSYNNTYVHRGFSLEQAILDAILLIQDGTHQHVLTGSYDEMTPEHFSVKQQWNYWKKEAITNTNLFSLPASPGTIAGEGTGFFMISNTPSPVEIIGIETLYKPSETHIGEALNQILTTQHISPQEIDLIISGYNGDQSMIHFDTFIQQKLSQAQTIYFKHLCGEYDTANHVAIWAAYTILCNQYIPQSMQLQPLNKTAIRYILIYNNYFSINQTLMLLKYHA